MDLQQYTGKRVILTRNLSKPNRDGHLAEEIEGKVEVVAPDNSALVIMPKGSTMNFMLEADEIEPDSIQIVVEKPKELKAKEMHPAHLLVVRQHLLDKHGWTLLAVNGMTDQEALEQHGNMTHRQLGHYHTEN